MLMEAYIYSKILFGNCQPLAHCYFCIGTSKWVSGISIQACQSYLILRLTTQYYAALRLPPHKYIGKNFWLTKNILFGSDLQATNVFCYAAAMLYVSTVRLVHLGNPAVTLVNPGYLLLLLLLLLLMLLQHRRSRYTAADDRRYRKALALEG